MQNSVQRRKVRPLRSTGNSEKLYVRLTEIQSLEMQDPGMQRMAEQMMGGAAIRCA